MWSWHDGGWDWGMWFMPLMMFIIFAAVVVGIIFLVRALWSRDSSSPGAGRDDFGSGAGRGGFGPDYGDGAGVSSRTPAPSPPPETPEALLKRRYAAGEIDREEYLQKREDLDS